MLLRRVITALALLVMLIPALLATQPWVWAGFSLIFVVLACWEWMRLLEPSRSQSAVFFALLAMGISGLTGLALEQRFWLEPMVIPVSVVACLAWCCLVPRSLSGFIHEAWIQAWFGWLFLLAAWLALLALHQQELTLLFSSLALVWVADVAAYFTGRYFGRRKLAPHISPGKTQEGAVGACFFVAVIGTLSALLGGSVWADALPRRWTLLLSTQMPEVLAVLIMLALLMFLVILSIVGDLYESQLKRLAGVKDSSKLLPGHGGILDRIDALLPTLPAVVLIDRWLHWLTQGARG